MQNALKSSELQRIWVIKTFKIEIKNWGPNNSDFLQIIAVTAKSFGFDILLSLIYCLAFEIIAVH